MSDPTRYRVADNQAQLTLGGNILVVDPAGPLVEYADYARLKAEVERLSNYVEMMDRESMSDEYDLNNQSRIINGLLRDKEQMQGKIDRLTNAGDLLVFHYTSIGRKFFPDDPLPFSITNWNEAKEGKQS